MSKKLMRLLALVLAMTMVAAACGSSDSEDSSGAGDDETDASESEDAMDDEPAAGDSADDEPAVDDAPAEEPEQPDEPEVDAIVAAFDANGDGTITIGVAAAGPRDDNGYYQSLVNFAESYSAENGFAAPIVSDNIGPAEAAQALSDLAQQGVDILMVGASEIAEPLPDLTEQFPDIFWYCNCGAGFQELPGLAQATDWGAAIHYSAGVAMAAVLQEQGSTSAVFLGLLRHQLRGRGLPSHPVRSPVCRPVVHHGVCRHRRL